MCHVVSASFYLTSILSHINIILNITELFAHNSMVHEFYRGDPLDVNTNTGVFGRMLDKLKLQGYQTSANSRGAGDQMLAGDQKYKNPIWGVSTSAPSDLNQDPTVLDIYEVVKELNGVGTPTSGVMSETWSSRVAAALFEHEQMKLIATMDEFDVETYGEGDLADGGSSLGSSFKAIIEYMKSRHFRKVNREVYVLSQDGYDNHDKNAVSDLFSKANDAIEDFVFELKQQGLWDNTVIVMGSDFGRSLNPNSNGGTDHAVSCDIADYEYIRKCVCISIISHMPLLNILSYIVGW